MTAATTLIDLDQQCIDQLFDDPFYSGVSGKSPLVPQTYQVSIDGHPYIITPAKYQRITVPLQRQSTDESVEPGEQTLNVSGAWRRSQDNWFLGAGQEFLDNRFAFVSVYVHSGEDPSVRTRFWRSKGVNPWTEGALSLLPECRRIKTTGQTPTALTLYVTKTKTGTTGKLTTSSATTATTTHQANTKVAPQGSGGGGHFLLPPTYFPLALGTTSTVKTSSEPAYARGAIWTANTLAGAQMQSGTWSFSAKVKVKTTNRSITGTFFFRVWRIRSGTAVQIGSDIAAYAVVGTTATTLTAAGSLPAATFGTTTHLAVDLVFKGNATTATTTVEVELGAANFTVVTPGYKAPSTGAAAKCMAVGSYLYYFDGSLFVTTNPRAPTPTWTAVGAPGGGAWPSVSQMATDGAHLYLACGTHGIAKVTPGSLTAVTLRPSAPEPTVTPKGTTGTTSYSYALVGRDANGFATLVGTFRTITNGNATLSTSNYNEITWTAVAGVVTWDLLRGTSGHAIATGLTTTSYTDNGSASTVTYTAPTTTTENFQATFVTYGNGFLLGGAGAQLCSVGANGSTTQIMKHFNPSFTWDAGCGSPVAIYVAGHAGTTSEVYGVQVSTTTFGLAAPYSAAQVGHGEVVHAMTYYQGIVILATSLGVRAAQDSGSNGFLTMGAVINALGASKALAAYGPYVWFGVTAYDQNDGVWTGTGISSGTGRLFLSEFSNPLIPAFATDVMATTGVEGTCTAIAVVGGDVYFTVANDGIWGPSGNVVKEGYLETGWVRYGTIENKILVAGAVRHDPLRQGQSVQLDVVPFGGTSFSLPPSNETGSIGPPEQVSAGNAVGEAFQIIPVLQRGTDATKGPTLRRWTCRAMVISVRQDQIVVPIIWSDSVLSPVGDGTILEMTLAVEWQFLKSLEREGGAFTYQEGALAYTCYVDQIELDGQKWNDSQTMMQGLCSVKLLTVQ